MRRFTHRFFVKIDFVKIVYKLCCLGSPPVPSTPLFVDFAEVPLLVPKCSIGSRVTRQLSYGSKLRVLAMLEKYFFVWPGARLLLASRATASFYVRVFLRSQPKAALGAAQIFWGRGFCNFQYLCIFRRWSGQCDVGRHAGNSNRSSLMELRNMLRPL